ncbi:FMN-binding protein [Umezawaea sp. Da 62-37]|uniref:FMN-binding protein n=1 Tax=Umezawaea sp. Da 62-37 TaxID=3075927 RepID=UPI0028F6E034|nr:FMN-binding protein [Umezawaea sp. Da 62-37]WNV81928.1 FMN-binding protein [Umezawaea sp. Da 62-37]
MKIHRAIPLVALSIAGLVPLWLYDPSAAETTEVAADVGIVPEAQTEATTEPPTTTTSAPAASGYGTAAPPTTTKPTTAQAVKTVNGPVVKTVHGDVQVQVTFTGDKITAVKFLKQPNTGPTKMAAPLLIQETLQAGSADVDSVSGATQTSEGYVTSLQAAIDAKGE